MKKIKFAGLALMAMFAIGSLSSCCSLTHAVAISPNQAMGSKVGTATQTTYLGMFGVGGPEQTLKNAAESAGITSISQVEEYDQLILGGFIIKHTIRVYGE